MSAVEAYATPGFDSPIDLDLSKNEGTTDAAGLLESVVDPVSAVSRYPDTTGLRKDLADLHGVPVESVLVTAGGDDALFRCFLARVGPESRVVTTTPTFEMIARYTGQQGAELVEVPWWEGSLPTESVLDAITDRVAAVFLVSPNNPTGSTITTSDLERIADQAPLLVLDAAYVEFADEDLTAMALTRDDTVVIRTMSKAYGLAGLRVGYLLGPPELVSEVGAYGNPYPVSALSAAVAVQRLRRPRAELDGFVAEVRRRRAELGALLTDLGARPLDSEANFVLARFDDPEWVVSAAASMGVALRRFPGRPDLDDVVRITVPSDEPDFERLATTLQAVLAPEALLLDMDGVLADVSRSQTIAIIQTALSYGVVLDGADIEAAKAQGNANDDWELTAGLITARGAQASLAEVTERYETIYQGTDGSLGLKSEERLLVDRSTLARWAASKPLAVVTGRPRSDAEEFVDRFDLGGVLSAMVTKDEAPLKPDPEPVRMALRLLGVKSAWMLGDTRDDLAAARGAGVVPIGVIAPGDDPDRSRESLRGAARVLGSATEVEGMLR